MRVSKQAVPSMGKGCFHGCDGILGRPIHGNGVFSWMEDRRVGDAPIKKADKPSFPMICPLWLPPKSNC